MRIVCFIYWGLLTLLLLSRNPLAWFSESQTAQSLFFQAEPVAHFVSFALLALLAMAPPWPFTRWGLLALLVFYGGVTELVQSRIPGRSMQMVDLLQDLAGIVVGTGLFWAWRRFRAPEPDSAKTLPVEDPWQRPLRRAELPMVHESASDA